MMLFLISYLIPLCPNLITRGSVRQRLRTCPSVWERTLLYHKILLYLYFNILKIFLKWYWHRWIFLESTFWSRSSENIILWHIPSLAWTTVSVACPWWWLPATLNPCTWFWRSPATLLRLTVVPSCCCMMNSWLWLGSEISWLKLFRYVWISCRDCWSPVPPADALESIVLVNGHC